MFPISLYTSTTVCCGPVKDPSVTFSTLTWVCCFEYLLNNANSRTGRRKGQGWNAEADDTLKHNVVICLGLSGPAGPMLAACTFVLGMLMCSINYKTKTFEEEHFIADWNVKCEILFSLCYFLLEFRCCMLRLKIGIFLLALYILLMDAWYNL